MDFQNKNAFVDNYPNGSPLSTPLDFEMKEEIRSHRKVTGDTEITLYGKTASLPAESNNIAALVEQQNVEQRRPVLRSVLRPILMLMRAFGFYYNDSSGLRKLGVSRCSMRFWKCYAYFVNAVIVAYFLRAIAGKSYHYVNVSEILFFKILNISYIRLPFQDR